MAQGKAFTEDERNAIFTQICNNVIENRISFNKAVKESEISLTLFYQWIVSSEDRKTLYNYAREVRSDVLFEEIVEIADTTEDGVITTEKPNGIEIKHADMIEHRRLKVDARKWVVSRMNPKKYGDKLDLSNNGESFAPTVTITPELVKSLSDNL